MIAGIPQGEAVDADGAGAVAARDHLAGNAGGELLRNDQAATASAITESTKDAFEHRTRHSEALAGQLASNAVAAPGWLRSTG